jgi:peptidoglycan hydrolase-like protein with peptidoglycan-binding domain
VQTLQQILNKLGFIIAPSGDGSPGHEVLNFGAHTQAAVIKFQKQYGITSDQSGVVGPATRQKLLSLSGS